MADGIVQVPPDSTGKKIDAASLDVGLNTVMRQRMVIADNSATAQFATVTSGALMVTGTVSLGAGTALIGAVSLGAGTANIGVLNNISATVTVAGTVSLGAGTAVIGDLNAISRTVQVAIGTPFTLNNISATTIVAGVISLGAGTNNIGFINNISASVSIATGATGDFDTGAPVQTLPILGIAVPAAGGAVIGGTATNPIIIGGTVDKISATVTVVGIVSLGAGTANIGFINNISATVVVAGTVSLGAGTANIGTINNVSATLAVVLAAGTANFGTLNNISATVSVLLAAGTANIGAVSVAAGTALMGAVSLAAGTANIGFINNISATVNCASGKVQLSAPATIANGTMVVPWADRFSRTIVQLNHPSLLPTASHGPRCITCSTSAGIVLAAAPGAGLSIFITSIANTNGSATLTRADVFANSLTTSCVCQMYMAASGGGFVEKYDPPIQLLSNAQVTCRVKPSVSKTIFNIHFYVGPK